MGFEYVSWEFRRCQFFGWSALYCHGPVRKVDWSDRILVAKLAVQCFHLQFVSRKGLSSLSLQLLHLCSVATWNWVE